MRAHDPLNRYVLVPRAGNGGQPVRRYSLARVAVSPRSALGVDRHERLERIAEQDLQRSNGGGPVNPA